MRFRNLRITEQPAIHLGEDRRHWKLGGELVTEWTGRNGRYRHVVEEGTRFRPSIPRPFRGAVALEDLLVASAAHDVIYRSASTDRHPVRIIRLDGLYAFTAQWTRATADRFMIAVMDADGASPWARAVTHAAIRAAGCAFWYDEEDTIERPDGSGP
jgi:hypothetical protein